MTKIQAKLALTPSGWARDVTVSITADGFIGTVASGPGDIQADILLPAPSNVHSHAFQRAMAGLTEAQSPSGKDSFWTWRDMMFRFLDHLAPGDVQAIAALVQMEMLESGYAACGEFHYLHHHPDGTHYSNIAEMSAAICAAAADTGMGLTLLPVLYQQGGADGRPLTQGQLRFGNDTTSFFKLLDAAQSAFAHLPPDTVMGAAPHSLRAATPDGIKAVVRGCTGPIHMHLAEQTGEVDEISLAYGQRPGEWLLNNIPPDDRWCLIHCTQLNTNEISGLAKSGAVAGLCPLTEASLGDGIFPGANWLAAGGALAIGSDSNIRITLTGELEQLEYSQRLQNKARAVMAGPGRSTGRSLYDATLGGGAQAMGRKAGQIAPGYLADLVALDGSAPDLIGRSGDQILDTWIFAAGDGLVRDVWSAGRHMVRDGRHVARDQILGSYRKCMKRLSEVL